MTLDPRLNAYRADLADARLRDKVAAPRYAKGQPGRVIAGLVPVLRLPPGATETFYHYGEPVLVFDLADGYAWCQSQFDGYVGYVAAGQIAIGAPPEPTGYIAAPGSYCYEAPDLRSAAADFLPRHSPVTIIEAGLTTRGTAYVRLDTGGYLPANCISPQPPRSRDLVTAASVYLGCPYLWGGRSFRGLDCSGLVQSAFRDLGITVLRDTYMQRDSIGEQIVANSPADLARGDLLYMPGHVLIHAGNDIVIHADGGSMTVRQDRLMAWLGDRGMSLADFTVRRHPTNS